MVIGYSVDGRASALRKSAECPRLVTEWRASSGLCAVWGPGPKFVCGLGPRPQTKHLAQNLTHLST
jgi:hypothetical protein